MELEYRNPKLLSNGWIDCEINHPHHGWIPFSANPNDKGAQFDVAALHAVMLADPNLDTSGETNEPDQTSV